MLLLISLSLTSTASANGPSNKLKRGLINTVSGWVEFPKNIYDKSVEESAVHGVTVGTVQGIGMTVVRTGCGIFEVVTFLIPIPADYKPILYPVYVIDDTFTPAEVDRVMIEGQKTYKLIGDNE